MKISNINFEYKSKIFLILPFLLYFLIATYKLAEPSLWMGEALEHYYASQNFQDLNYLVMNTSFQPPLYVWLLSLWIKVNDSVFLD